MKRSSALNGMSAIVMALQVGEPHAAMYLGGKRGDLTAHIVQVCLGLQRREAGLVGQRVLRVRGVPDQRAAGLQHGGEIGQRMLDGLE